MANKEKEGGVRTTTGIVRFAADHYLVVSLGSVLALVWANTSAEKYFAFALTWSWAVNDVGLTLFFALVTQEIVEATMPGGALGRWRRAMLRIIAAQPITGARRR